MQFSFLGKKVERLWSDSQLQGIVHVSIHLLIQLPQSISAWGVQFTKCWEYNSEGASWHSNI
jgi:hypothetical protein